MEIMVMRCEAADLWIFLTNYNLKYNTQKKKKKRKETFLPKKESKLTHPKKFMMLK